MLALTFVLFLTLTSTPFITSEKPYDLHKHLSVVQLFYNFDATRILNQGETGEDLKKLLQYKLQFSKKDDVTSMDVTLPGAENAEKDEVPLLEDMGEGFKIYHSSLEKYKKPRYLELDFSSQVLDLNKTITKDPCKKLGLALDEDTSFVPYDYVRDCYLSFPYNHSLAQKTVEAMKSILPFYVFLDLSARKLNLTDPTIFNVSDGKDFTFHEQLSDRVKSLYDGHFVYKPKCYRAFTFKQPIYLSSVVDEKNRTRVFVSNYTNKVFHPELKKYGGWEVSKMDLGITKNSSLCPASDIQIYSDLHNGMYRSTRTRYNSALSRSYMRCDSLIIKPGDILATSTMPRSAYVTYRFLNSSGYETEDIKVPWVANVNSETFEELDFTNGATYWKNLCLASPRVKKTEVAEKPSPVVDYFTPLYDDFDISPSGKYECKPKKNKNDSFFGDDLFEIIYLSEHFSVYGHNDTRTAVIHLITFNILDGQDGDDWMFGLLEAFSRLHKRGYRKLLLDLSENSGGMTCLATSFAQYIDRISDPKFIPERPYPEYTALRYSKELVKMSKQAGGSYNIFSEKAYFYANEEKWNFTTASVSFGRNITLPNHQKKRLQGNLVANLTRKCDAIYAKLIRSVEWRVKRSNIIVASNAICGSACAVLLNALNRGGIKTVAISTSTMSTDPPMSIQAFAGGEKMTSDDLLKFTSAFKDSTIKPFPTKAALDFTFRGVGMMQNGDFRMLEYAMWPANAETRITAENVFRPKLIWNTIITKAFKSDFQKYPIFQETKNPKYSFFNVFDVPNLKCHIDNILSFLLTWDNGNIW